MPNPLDYIGNPPAQQIHVHKVAEPLSVNTGAIQDNAVTTAKIADGAVTSAKIADGTITTTDIADGTITLADLAASLVAFLVPVGTVLLTGGSTADTGFVLCDGAAISRTTFSALFTRIGTTYGVGDGSTTFNVPDLRGRFALGKATSGTGSTLGGTGGSIDHTHGLDTSSSHAKIYMNDTTDQISSEVKAVANWTRNAGASLVTNATGATDAGAAKLAGSSDVGNPPFQALNYEIKT